MARAKSTPKATAGSAGRLKFVKHAPPLETPIAWDADGNIRVGGTRVTLDVVIDAFKRGNSPEKIARSFDTLDLADIYATIAYYLRHTEEVEGYLLQLEEKTEEAVAMIEADPVQKAFRERMLTRIAERGRA